MNETKWYETKLKPNIWYFESFHLKLWDFAQVTVILEKITVFKIGIESNPFFRRQIHFYDRLCWPGDLNKDPNHWLDGA
jgi:hypothetical protein